MVVGLRNLICLLIAMKKMIKQIKQITSKSKFSIVYVKYLWIIAFKFGPTTPVWTPRDIISRK